MSGIAGVVSLPGGSASNVIWYMLYALQHRGQQSAGIAVYNRGLMDYHKSEGLVSEVFTPDKVQRLQGNMAIGHVRMAAKGEGADYPYQQPIVAGFRRGAMGVVHDGHISNFRAIRSFLEDHGAIFQSELDTEVIASLIARNFEGDMREAVAKTLNQLTGSFAMIVMADGKLYAARDHYGIKPLSLGKLNGRYLVASETCAFDSIGAEFVRDLEPGEAVEITEEGIETFRKGDPSRRKLGIFEMVYIARPDSMIDGRSIYLARLSAGKILAKEHPADADIVIGAPDSGISFAIGYAEASKLPYSEGIIKNRYVGRTFIQPSQELRDLGVKIKLNPLREYIENKRLVLVDDSIVRGTTMKRTVKMLKDAGAKEVHVRIGSPEVRYSSNLVMDTPTREELISAVRTKEEIIRELGCDSLEFISLEGLFEACGGEDFTQGCFSGVFPEGSLDETFDPGE